MKYPIDPQTAERLLGQIVAHERAQRQTIQAMEIILKLAFDDASGDEDWYDEAKNLLKMQTRLKLDHDNRIFNEKNGRVEPPSHLTPEIAQTSYAEVMPHLGIHGQIDDPEINAQINEREAKEFGSEMSEEEIAKLFREKPKKPKKGDVDMSKKDPFKNMTLEEIEEWERKQDNANDLFKVKARIANLASGISGGNLTAVGTMMVNSFVHVVKDLYDFAETIPDKSLRIALTERIRKHESMPGTLIAAASAGVKERTGGKK